MKRTRMIMDDHSSRGSPSCKAPDCRVEDTKLCWDSRLPFLPVKNFGQILDSDGTILLCLHKPMGIAH